MHPLSVIVLTPGGALTAVGVLTGTRMAPGKGLDETPATTTADATLIQVATIIANNAAPTNGLSMELMLR